MRKNIEADNLTVAGDLTVTGNVTVQGTSDIVVGDDLTVTGDISGATVTSTGATTAGSLVVTGAASAGSLGVTGAATVGTTLGVTGATTLSGGVTVATGQALTVNGVSYDYEVEGIKQAAPNAGRRSIGTRVTNVLNSLAVTGAIQGDNLRSRNAHPNTLARRKNTNISPSTKRDFSSPRGQRLWMREESLSPS